jgi:hypothetical protein
MRNIHFGKLWPKNVAKLYDFQETAQSKQSPNGRKFAQSGHTVRDGQREVFYTNFRAYGKFRAYRNVWAYAMVAPGSVRSQARTRALA